MLIGEHDNDNRKIPFANEEGIQDCKDLINRDKALIDAIFANNRDLQNGFSGEIIPHTMTYKQLKYSCYFAMIAMKKNKYNNG
jgi:hypothetical protein